jgi:hypothetical protein
MFIPRTSWQPFLNALRKAYSCSTCSIPELLSTLLDNREEVTIVRGSKCVAQSQGPLFSDQCFLGHVEYKAVIVRALKSTSIGIMHLFVRPELQVTALEVLGVQRSLNACLYRNRALNINALRRAMTA